ncbi:MAG: hypothetical protein COV59_03655 [Candidatus Magasanikbacteria bacterium CG11_big_fil_rev_8_21_14_0_20_39_34]|uniref:Uncharacterized protein n=1 Tax=Candidatus Magasanikbacteria bacterium CG11_big_fil_rev_8_21_14_0_20_39_34 TaxID=1974653 RepID=A0A2H0N5S8_9BACT|nr:MAG: hypothetical protein COV59_03655 [Candidatus Magasanikbacteria bacterium CG11_big_fil_rev_8_21_14_0_20_39_34]
MGKFKKGLFLGALLGASMTWMSTTKKGRETRDQMLDFSSDIYEEVQSKILKSDAWKKMGKQEFVCEVREVVEKFAKEHKWAVSVKNMIVKLVSSQWGTFQKEIQKLKKQ